MDENELRNALSKQKYQNFISKYVIPETLRVSI